MSLDSLTASALGAVGLSGSYGGRDNSSGASPVQDYRYPVGNHGRFAARRATPRSVGLCRNRVRSPGNDFFRMLRPPHRSLTLAGLLFGRAHDVILNVVLAAHSKLCRAADRTQSRDADLGHTLFNLLRLAQSARRRHQPQAAPQTSRRPVCTVGRRRRQRQQLCSRQQPDRAHQVAVVLPWLSHMCSAQRCLRGCRVIDEAAICI